ncbi:hypothetical protein DOTSEDRAFT_49594 [Dothistroma septosporum NZE10]|uniref:PXA domain-containing protein n=1 Tax=Dothistroma septosporum (strain NZE10 / CBS 128990) TaxID=675120 RepID=N1Q228_DOTSN|nr:hypothetical protein DOTSEDRAFT_49594 [Dothistroma septosporum NZE10]
MAERARRPEGRDAGAEWSQRRGNRSQERHIEHEQPTTTYIKRILCAQAQAERLAAKSATESDDARTLEQLLPPLTSSNAIDVQLYAFIAVILSNFVQIWYNRVTPDQQFVSEILQIIAHCTRGLEQRLRQVDLEALLLDELPQVLTEHVEVIRMAQRSNQPEPTPFQQRTRYHTLRPHLALSPVPIDAETSLLQHDNETAWCLLLVKQALPLLLPPEDLQNPCLEVLVSEIFSEMILRSGILGRASEPWLLWDGIAKLVRSPRPSAQRASSSSDQLEELGLLNPTTKERLPHSRSRWRLDTLTQASWLIVQGILTSYTMTRAAVVAVMQAASIPARPSRTSYATSAERLSAFTNANSKRAESPAEDLEKRPLISMSLWGCISELLLLEQRMPWLSGILSLLQWLTLCGPGKLCDTNSRLDRLMSSKIHQELLSANRLRSVLHAARNALFPGNSLAAPRIPPSDGEVIQIKRECVMAILDAIPGPIQAQFFASIDKGEMVEEIGAELDLLGDAHINKHLIVSMIELVVVRLFPELAEANSVGRQSVH